VFDTTQAGTLGVVTAEYFDQWFADIGQSKAEQRLFSEALGVPEEVGPSNTLPIEGLRAVADAVGVEPGGLLVDIACGRGGPGMWIARELGAELMGIDFSAEAVEQATTRRALFGMESTATFAVGSFDATGLSAGCADAVICIDAFQFASDPVQAAEEMRRVLRTHGRVALTCWEPVDRSDESLSERIRKVDLYAALTAAGFTEIERIKQPRWYETERLLWEKIRATDPAGDPALESAHQEAERTLATWDLRVRVMATAIAP
jgi:SAM-dependent methyltransferase